MFTILTITKPKHINKRTPSLKVFSKPLSNQQKVYYLMNIRMFTNIKWVSRKEYLDYYKSF